MLYAIHYVLRNLRDCQILEPVRQIGVANGKTALWLRMNDPMTVDPIAKQALFSAALAPARCSATRCRPNVSSQKSKTSARIVTGVDSVS